MTMQSQDHPPSSSYNPHYINNDGEVEQPSSSSSSQVTTAEAEAEAVKKSSSLSRWIKVISGLLFIAFIAYVIGKC